MKREYQKVRDMNGEGYKIVGYEYEHEEEGVKNLEA